MPNVPDDPEALLRREPAAEALTEAGFKTAPKTLATLASRGGGPRYRKYAKYPLYRWGDLLDRARSRLGPPIRSTSEIDVLRRAPRRCEPCATRTVPWDS